jgi:hypothetical protein
MYSTNTQQDAFLKDEICNSTKIHRNHQSADITFVTVRSLLYAFGIWSLSLREEHKLRVSEDRVVRMFVPREGLIAETYKVMSRDIR